MFEGSTHLVELVRLTLELGGLGRRQRLDVGAGPAAVVPKRQQPADLVDSEPEIARPPDEAKGVEIALVIIPIARLSPFSGPNQANLLVVTNHSLADTARIRNLADLHSRTLRNRSELPMTETELNAIAAPAMIGLSRIPNQG